MNNLISIIIPAYNAEKYIARAIKSVLNQSYRNIEIIVIDDGSKDNTAEVVKAFGKRVEYYYQENNGVAAARNLGIEKSNGKYLGFLDADDYVLSEMYALMLRDIQKNNSDISMCNIYLENDQGTRVKAFSFKDGTIQLNKPKVWNVAFKYLGNSSCNKLYKKSTMGEIRFPFYKRGEDALFVLEVFLKSSSISVTNEALYVYFQNSNSVTKSEIDLVVINNYIKVHSEKRNLINKYLKNQILKPALKDYYVKCFLMYTNAIRQVKSSSDKNEYWDKWLTINKNDFVKNTSLNFVFNLSKNINWVYYSGMIVTGKSIKPILDRIKHVNYFFNKR